MTGRDPRWLNVGCGDVIAPAPWTNVDPCAELEPDVVAPITALPFGDGSVWWIYAGHVFEHLEWFSEVQAALVECRRVLHDGGHICIVGPDCDRARATGDEDLWAACIYGGNRWPGDEHKWMCTESVFLPVIRSVFPGAISVPPAALSTGWPIPNRAAWQLAVIA